VNNIEVIYSDVILVLKGLSLVVRRDRSSRCWAPTGRGRAPPSRRSRAPQIEEGEVTDGEILFAAKRSTGRTAEEIVRKGVSR